jgi:hypothetical protein
MPSLQGDAPLPYPSDVRTSTLALVLPLVLSGAARAADPVPVGGIGDIVGPRSLALQASTGIASGNEGLYVNPGAIASRKRYEIDGGAFFDRRGADTVGQVFGGSIVDSESSPMTAGVSYLRVQKGPYEGNLVHFALAGPLTEGFYLGVLGKYLSLTGQTVGGTPVLGTPASPASPITLPNVSAVTADAGIFWQVAHLVSLGVAGYNLVPVGNKIVAPLGMGAGVAVGSDRSFQVTGDWRTDFDAPAGRNANRWAAGAEALLFDMVPVRAGWMKDGPLDTSWWSAGVGLVTPTGVALDVGYRQSMDDPKARVIAATLKLFVNVGK